MRWERDMACGMQPSGNITDAGYPRWQPVQRPPFTNVQVCLVRWDYIIFETPFCRAIFESTAFSCVQSVFLMAFSEG